MRHYLFRCSFVQITEHIYSTIQKLCAENSVKRCPIILVNPDTFAGATFWARFFDIRFQKRHLIKSDSSEFFQKKWKQDLRQKPGWLLEDMWFWNKKDSRRGVLTLIKLLGVFFKYLLYPFKYLLYPTSFRR